MELIKENTKAETVTEFADRCRECGTHFIPISVLEDIKAEVQTLRNCSCSNSDGIIDDIEDILDKYKTEQEET